MTILGKILFYNEQNGNGIIITKENQKFEFAITSWSDYDTLPSTGLEVLLECNENGTIDAIEVIKPDLLLSDSLQKENTQESQKIKINTPKTDNFKKPAKKKRYTPKNEAINNATLQLDALLNDTGDGIKKLLENISLSIDINDTMKEYFDELKLKLNEREGYKKVNGRLKFHLAKRFLWTTYYNLIEIDPNILTPRIKSIGDDLKMMSQIKEKFDQRIRYPLSAFEDIFLASQSEYQLVKKMTKESIERLAFLRSKGDNIAKEKKKKQQEIDKEIDRNKKLALTRELKVLNGTYVDIVHMFARLQEISQLNTKRLQEFENNYKEDFFKQFRQESKKYHKDIIEILDAQAYLLDNLLWKTAKVSDAVVNYFKTVDIDIELNTMTYLKYYLSTLDESKVNKNTQELFTYYDYLAELHKECILLLLSSAQDVMEYAAYIQKKEKDMLVKSFISEVESLKWAAQNSVKIIIIGDKLSSTTAQQYLEYYHQHIFSKPKIFIIGRTDNTTSNNYNIQQMLPENISPKILYETIKVS